MKVGIQDGLCYLPSSLITKDQRQRLVERSGELSTPWTRAQKVAKDPGIMQGLRCCTAGWLTPLCLTGHLDVRQVKAWASWLQRT